MPAIVAFPTCVKFAQTLGAPIRAYQLAHEVSGKFARVVSIHNGIQLDCHLAINDSAIRMVALGIMPLLKFYNFGIHIFLSRASSHRPAGG